MLKETLYHIIRIVARSESAVRLNISINPQHPIFQGHFPGNPVTPGAAMVQILKEMVSEHLQKPLRLVEVRQVKFLGMLVPERTTVLLLEFELSPAAGSPVFGVKARLSDAERTFMKFTGRFEVESG